MAASTRSARARRFSVALVSSPLGLLKVALREGKLLALAFPAEERFLARLSRRLPDPRPPSRLACGEPSGPDAAALAELSRQLGLYFSRLKKSFFLPLVPVGTPFQQRVWAELQRIPYGSVRTYAEVARALGSPKLARAVGGACAANPLPIVIPCHRVVASGGGLGGYSAGLEVKRLLLELESGGRH